MNLTCAVISTADLIVLYLFIWKKNNNPKMTDLNAELTKLFGLKCLLTIPYTPDGH